MYKGNDSARAAVVSAINLRIDALQSPRARKLLWTSSLEVADNSAAEAVEDINEALNAVGESPLICRRQWKRRAPYVKRKVNSLQKNTEKRMCSYLGVPRASTSAEQRSEHFELNEYVSLMKG